MGSYRVFDGFRLFQDNGDVCTDGTIEWDLAGSTTPLTVYSDRELTTSLGATVSLSSTGWAPDIWVSDQVSTKATILGTGVTTRVIDYLTVAASSATDSGASASEFKNFLSNGAFALWSAGTSFSNISGSGTGVETADGWYFVQPVAASNAVSRQTATTVGARYGMRFGRPAASTSTNQLRLWKTILTDEAYRLSGQTVTVSFTAFAGANFSAASSALSVILATGTTEDQSGDLIASSGWGGQQNEVNQSQIITTTATRYQFTASVDAGTKEVGVQFAYTGVGTAGANDWVQIEDVQVEIDSAATDFHQAPTPLDFVRDNLTAGGQLFLTSTFTDPGADRLLGWDDSASAIIGFTMPAAGLALSGTGIVLANDLAALEAFSGTGATGLAYRSGADAWGSVTIGANLGFSGGTLGSSLGTAAVATIGTSGATVPLNNTANTFSANLTFTGSLVGVTLGGGGRLVDQTGTERTLVYANGDTFEVLVESGASSIFRAGNGDTAPTFKSQVVYHAGNLPGTAITWTAQPVFTAGSRVTQGGVNVDIVGASSIGFIGTQTNHPLVIRTNDTEVGRFFTGGGFQARAASSTETTGTLTSASANKTINATGGITINDGVFTAGDMILIYAGSSSRTITQDTGMTLRLDGTATTGNRTIAAYGKMHVYFNSNSEAICSGQGVS